MRKPVFAQVLRNGKRLRGKAATLLVRPNQVQYPRLGMIVPKRVFARAVDRNKIKRIIREWFRTNQLRLAGRDWIVQLGIEGKTPTVLDRGRLQVELDRLTPESIP